MESLTPYQNTYVENKTVGATPNPVMLNPDALDEEFAATANAVLCNAVELVRILIGAHQSAIAVIVQNDWTSVRKYFSMSEKYEAWKHYNTPATGYGIHNWLLGHNKTVRLTQGELEAHPEWKGFGSETGKHPPMRGWLATPLLDRGGKNWGLVQLSDKLQGEFTEWDEKLVVDFTRLVAVALQTAWEKRCLQKAAKGLPV